MEIYLERFGAFPAWELDGLLDVLQCRVSRKYEPENEPLAVLICTTLERRQRIWYN